MTDVELREALARYVFYHTIKLTDTISTPGNPTYLRAQNLCLNHLQQLDLKGKRVLDIGCRDGLFSFAAERMGAAEVVGIDNDVSKGATELLIPFLKSKVRMQQINLYDVTAERFGFFDVVIVPGVLYHLRYPFWGLRAIRDVMKPGADLLIETAIWEGEPNNPMLFCPVEGDSPYEGDSTSCTFFNVRGLVDTLKSLGFQTLQVELLNKHEPTTTRRHRLRRMLKEVKAGFKPVAPPPITEINRGLIRCVFNAFDKTSFTNRYWDATHDYHTLRGG